MASSLARRLVGEAQGTPPGPSPDDDLLRDVVHQAIRPHIKITFLDNGEQMDIELKEVHNAWWVGVLPQPGLAPAPTDSQLLRFCLHPELCKDMDEWKQAGKLAIDGIKNVRYEDAKLEGEFGSFESAGDNAYLAHRAFKYEWKNDTGEKDPMYRRESAEDEKMMRQLTRRALRTYLKITFDDDKRVLCIPLKWYKDVYMTGGGWFPGLKPEPTQRQLATIGGPVGGISGGEWAMELIVNSRYEGGERSGHEGYDDAEDEERVKREIPNMYYRPFTWSYENEGEAPDELYT